MVNGTFLLYKISIQHVVFANEIDECSNKLDEWGGFAAFVTVNVYDRASRAYAYHRALENIFVTGSRTFLGSDIEGALTHTPLIGVVVTNSGEFTSCTFSRHGKVQTSLTLIVWLTKKFVSQASR